LAAAVRAAKDGNPLAPVTVIVPTNTAGVMARRALGRRGGVTAIDVLTSYRLAELLGSQSLLDDGRKPVSTPVVDLAVKQVLRTSPGLYRQVADHPSTVVALRDLYREIRLAGPDALTALARTGRGREPSRVAAELTRLLSPTWYDEGDLMTRAAIAARRAPARRLSRLVVFLPERLRPLEVELLRALGERGEISLLVGVTGDAQADASATSLVEELTGETLPAGAEPPRTKPAIDVVSTTDADDEVRIAVRAILDTARTGMRFDRMAIAWPTDRPYARLVEHQLTMAGIPWNGRPGTGTGERAVPRVLAELLELDRRGLRRSDLMALLGELPARGADGRWVPASHWERIARRAGVVRDDWDERLRRFIAEADEQGWSSGPAADALLGFVTELRTALGDPATPRPWRDWSAWSEQQLDRWFGPGTLAGFGALGDVDGDELQAYRHTQQVLDRLRHLDGIGEAVRRDEFREMFVAELDVRPARRGTVGDGVHVGLLAAARALDVDLVVVLGAVEGLLPPPPSVDPLLGDDDREAAGLAGSTELAALAHRQFLAAVKTTPSVLVTVPRGDLRATTDYQPSRWLQRLVAEEDIRSVDSHVHGVASAVFPVTAAEHRVRELLTRVRSGAELRTHPLVATDQVLGRAVRLRDARASDVFTEYDGDLSARSMPAVEGPISPTSIEAWAACPYAYFGRYLLGVRPVDEPDELVSITALDRGSALHDAIHRLHRAVLDGEATAPGPTGWSAEHGELLARYGGEVADELEAVGRTGRPAFWAFQRPQLLDELAEWIARDAENWDGRRLRYSEVAFGADPPVVIRLPDGRAVSFTGQVDRVDERTDGSLVVTDHKTGRDQNYTKLSDEDPTVGGTRFQLPVYAAAARVLTGQPDATVWAEYAFFRKAKFRRRGITLDDTALARVGTELGRVVAGIEAGVFPPIPDPPGYQHFVACWYCTPDGLGTAERWAEWDRKRRDPRLARWFPEESPA
jgi:ATP-dependent helicase/nuclease subunit B